MIDNHINSPALLCFTFEDFIEHTKTANIDKLTKCLAKNLSNNGRPPNDSEKNAWQNSLPELANFLEACGIANESLIFIEYQLPITQERVDCILLGNDGNTDVAVIFELKQWSKDGIKKMQNSNIYRISKQEKDKVDEQEKKYYESLHPSIQALGYKNVLLDALGLKNHQELKIQAFAFLHNWDKIDESILSNDADAKDAINEVPLIGKDDNSKNSAKSTLETIKCAPTNPGLIQNPEIKFSEQFFLDINSQLSKITTTTLTSPQQINFNRILGAIENNKTNDPNKYHIVVSGGVGTGKSLLALKLMQHCIDKKIPTQYMVNSLTINANIWKSFSKNNKIKGLFGYSSNVRKIDPEVKKSSIIAIFDEAHRAKDILDYATAMKNFNLCIFFMDTRQIILRNERCYPESVKKIADLLNETGASKHHIVELNLEDQIRCDGGNLYTNWLESILFKEGAINDITTLENYEVSVFESPSSMEDALKLKCIAYNTTRMVAGYCWDWSNPTTKSGKKSLVEDIKISDWTAPWNEKPLSMYNKSKWEFNKDWEKHTFCSWMTPSFTREVGCIYTTQGMEFDYVGVIIGPDLIWSPEKNQWDAQLENSKDSTLKNSLAGSNAQSKLEIIKNIYWVLSTRGTKGTFFYSQDANTRAYLKKCLESIKPQT